MHVLCIQDRELPLRYSTISMEKHILPLHNQCLLNQHFTNHLAGTEYSLKIHRSSVTPTISHYEIQNSSLLPYLQDRHLIKHYLINC